MRTTPQDYNSNQTGGATSAMVNSVVEGIRNLDLTEQNGKEQNGKLRNGTKGILRHTHTSSNSTAEPSQPSLPPQLPQAASADSILNGNELRTPAPETVLRAPQQREEFDFIKDLIAKQGGGGGGGRRGPKGKGKGGKGKGGKGKVEEVKDDGKKHVRFAAWDDVFE